LKTILKLPKFDPVDLDPRKYKNLEIFIECLSKNKLMRGDCSFLYQVFPSNISFYHKFLMQACEENALDTVQRIITFFIQDNIDFINMREDGTLNTALHVAVGNGFFVSHFSS
jgi:hypothetical protein